VEEHVSACPGCQRVLQQLVGSLPDPLVPVTEPPAADADEQAPALTGYAPLGRIDAGGMGVVWRVRDLQFERPLAVKVIKAPLRDNPLAVHRFLAEARITGQLAHPSVVPVHAMGRLPDGRLYYTMKLVEGQTLAALLRGRPSPASRHAEVVQVFARVCQAVAYAHTRGVIHRDLKPANVMVGAFGEVQVMDWGLAKVLADARPAPEAEPSVVGAESEEIARTRAGTILGTFAYMAPEQARGLVEEVDRRSDVFGLGAILCEVLTGEPPYTGPDAQAVHRQASQADLASARTRLRGCGADPELVRLAEHCLAPAKADRPADAGAVAEAVAAYLGGVEERLQQERLERERQRVRALEQRRRRKLWLGLGAAVLAALGLAAGGWLYLQGQRSQRHREASEALAQAEGQLRAGAFAAARESLTRAKDRLGGDGPADLAGRFQGLQAAWQLVQDLEQIQRDRITPTAEGLFDNDTAQQNYARKFAEGGYDLAGGDPQELARRIHDSPVRDPILAAIDNWALVCAYDMQSGPGPKEEYRRRRDRLLEVARAVDPDPQFRDKVRSPHVWDDRKQLEELAGRAPRTDLSPRLAALLAEVLRWAGGDPEPLLRTFQSRHPEDFWLNFDLAKRLDATRPAEALRYYQAALAVGPHNVVLYCHIGDNLLDRCYWHEAAAVFGEALGKMADDAPQSVGLRNSLGLVLVEKGDLDGALALFQENVRIGPRQAGTHLSLGECLKQLGRFAEALDSFRRGQQVAAETNSRFRAEAEQMVRDAERLVELDRRFEAGKAEPASAAEALEFAEVCYCKRRYADAVEFYRRGFGQEPRPAGGEDAGRRYQAACAAALAAGGGVADARDAARRAALRKQALTWLREELDGWGRRAGDPKARPQAEAALRRWRQHPNLAGLRDPDALARLADGERKAWRQFWADVNALASQVQVN
jgi:serine/threonine-protein kinase